MPKPNIPFLNDLLSSIGANVRRRSAPGTGSAAATQASLSAACARLMRPSGEASRIAVAGEALDAFAALDAEERVAFFRSLLEDYGAEAEAIRAAYAAWDAAPSQARLARLFAAVEPRRQTLLRRLNLAPGGTLQLVRMRARLLEAMRDHRDLAPLDADFAHLLASWFNRGFLVMRRIDWDTPASILERIVAYEAVHAIRDWDDLRRRLDPADRRCYGFFHPATGDEPLIFVEVALCRGVPASIGPLLAAGDGRSAPDADTAAFYSISNCQPGLKGVSFGNFLIKQVARDLRQELPGLETFVTLSPAPGFAEWLAAQPEAEARALSAALAEGAWRDDPMRAATLAPRVKGWAARYFVEAKTDRGAPVDPVARFHLGNGASAHRINWPADLSTTALDRAHGLMINYLYDLQAIEARHEAFFAEGVVACDPEVRRALAAARSPA